MSPKWIAAPVVLLFAIQSQPTIAAANIPPKARPAAAAAPAGAPNPSAKSAHRIPATAARDLSPAAGEPARAAASKPSRRKLWLITAAVAIGVVVTVLLIRQFRGPPVYHVQP